MKKKFLLVVLVVFVLTKGIIFADGFSYDNYKFLTESEWEIFYGYEECGEVKIIPYKKGGGKLLQRKWWDDSYDYIEVYNQKKFTVLGEEMYYLIKQIDKKQISYECITDHFFSGVDIRAKNNTYTDYLGCWKFSFKDKFKYEIRETESDDYVFFFYIEGLQRVDAEGKRPKYFASWFLLKYKDMRTFVTDGAFENDKFRLEIYSKYLYFIPEFEFDSNILISKYKIYKKE